MTFRRQHQQVPLGRGGRREGFRIPALSTGEASLDARSPPSLTSFPFPAHTTQICILKHRSQVVNSTPNQKAKSFCKPKGRSTYIIPKSVALMAIVGLTGQGEERCEVRALQATSWSQVAETTSVKNFNQIGV